MLRQTLNELRVRLEIRPASPLLVKEGRPDTQQQDLMAFVYSRTEQGLHQYYLPGSSLRGVRGPNLAKLSPGTHGCTGNRAC